MDNYFIDNGWKQRSKRYQKHGRKTTRKGGNSNQRNSNKHGEANTWAQEINQHWKRKQVTLSPTWPRASRKTCEAKRFPINALPVVLKTEILTYLTPPEHFNIYTNGFIEMEQRLRYDNRPRKRNIYKKAVRCPVCDLTFWGLLERKGEVCRVCLNNKEVYLSLIHI